MIFNICRAHLKNKIKQLSNIYEIQISQSGKHKYSAQNWQMQVTYKYKWKQMKLKSLIYEYKYRNTLFTADPHTR